MTNIYAPAQNGIIPVVPVNTTWIVPVALAVLSLAMSSWSSYTNQDRITSQRITVVETNRRNDNARLDRIENKVDELLRRVH